MSSFLISWCEIEETDLIRKDTFPSPLCSRLPYSKNVQTHWNVSIKRESKEQRNRKSERKSKRLLCDIYPDSFACLTSILSSTQRFSFVKKFAFDVAEDEMKSLLTLSFRRQDGSWIFSEHREENLFCGIYWTFSEQRRKRSDQSRFRSLPRAKNSCLPIVSKENQ